MTDYKLPASAIEAAAMAVADADASYGKGRIDWNEKLAEAALRAAFDELGMRVDEKERGWLGTEPRPKPIYRLVSRWMPVEEPERSPFDFEGL